MLRKLIAFFTLALWSVLVYGQDTLPWPSNFGYLNNSIFLSTQPLRALYDEIPLYIEFLTKEQRTIELKLAHIRKCDEFIGNPFMGYYPRYLGSGFAVETGFKNYRAEHFNGRVAYQTYLQFGLGYSRTSFENEGLGYYRGPEHLDNIIVYASQVRNTITGRIQVGRMIFKPPFILNFHAGIGGRIAIVDTDILGCNCCDSPYGKRRISQEITFPYGISKGSYPVPTLHLGMRVGIIIPRMNKPTLSH